MKNIIICAAKTGGHIFPALGFAKEALKNDYKITFLGTNTDLEKKIFQQNENIDFIKFELDGFRGKSITQKLIFLINSFLVKSLDESFILRLILASSSFIEM